MDLPRQMSRVRTPAAAWLLTVALLAVAPMADGAVLQTRMTGGLVSGDLAGTAITNAASTVAASYDPAGHFGKA